MPGLYSIRQGSDRAHLFKMKYSPPSTSCLGGWPSSIVPHLAPGGSLAARRRAPTTGWQRSAGAGAPPYKTPPCFTARNTAQHARRKGCVTRHASDKAHQRRLGLQSRGGLQPQRQVSLPCRARRAPDNGVVVGVRHAHDALCIRGRHLHRVVLGAPRRVEPARRGRRALNALAAESAGISSTAKGLQT